MDIAQLTLRDLNTEINDPTTGAPAAGSQPAIAANSGTTLRRCRTREQGFALVTVGHAIEYLIDSRLAKLEPTPLPEREALAILLRANLSVYNEGTEVVHLITRLRLWFEGSAPLHRKTAAVPVAR